MPSPEHLVVCGGLDRPRTGDATRLRLHGKLANVRLQISDISRRLVANIPGVLVDLLEVATYIYSADSAFPRGGRTDAQMGARWRRKFRFVIPVRLPDLWSSNSVSSGLVEALSFLSEDDYQFEFTSLTELPPVARYFEFPDAEGSGFTPDEVILFSGGLDSLAGTVDELAAHGNKVALVSHRSASKIAGAQKNLVHWLQSRFGADRVLHIPVWANVHEDLGTEQTHRTRSFLYAALGAVTARLFGKDRICIFENGVVSLNLPTLAQVVGARASRTTHPQVLANFSGVLGAVLDRSFDVDNPFAWLTKSEVVERISRNGCGDMIRHTRSCTRVHEMTTLNPHCGLCSQCIDRRFAVLAASQEHEDPEEAYKVDLFTGERPAGSDQELALAFVRSASQINQMADVAFFARYGETSRIVSFFSEPANEVAGRIFDLYRRHASAVCRVFEEAISAHAAALREGTLPSACLLLLVVGQRDGADVYPVQSTVVKQAVTAGALIRVAIDEARRRVIFDRWGEIAGVSAELITVLAEPFRRAMRDEIAPENYPFTETSQLLNQTRCDDDEKFRKRVHRCRNKIAKLAHDAGDPAPPLDAVIENSQWHGYRLNPDHIRIVALSELRERQ